MNDELKILVTANLNVDKSTQEINSAISKIESKIQNLKLNIQVDEKVSKTLSDFSKAMENQKKISQDLNKVIKEEKTITKEANGAIKEKITQHLKSGEIIQKEIEKIDKKKVALKSETEAIRKQITEIEKLGEIQKKVSKQDASGQQNGGTDTYKNGTTNTAYNYDKDGNVTSAKVTQNLEQQRKLSEELANSQIRLRQEFSKLNKEGSITTSSLSRLNGAIDNAKNISEVKRLEQVLKNTNENVKTNDALGNYKKQAGINVQNLTRSTGISPDDSGVKSYLASVDALTSRTPALSKQLATLNMDFRQLSANAKDSSHQASQATESFGYMLSTAMTKFPVWMLSATLFYAPIQAMESMVSRIIEIDGLMVNLQRVMDAPEYRFNALLEDAVNVSDQLSSKLTDVLTIMGEFARMGDYSNAQLVDLSTTAQTLQNISDLDATASVDTLTSAMLNYNIAAEDSITIADKLNEVDNNYAISTKDLSDGIRKSASTAKTFGVELDTLVGYIAAIGSTTRESGAIVGNGLKTIISRITTMNDAEDSLNGVNISIRDMAGNVRPVSDILGELAGKWTDLSDEQRQNLGVSVAGRYQLSRFLALMNNFSMSVDATNTSINSQGSSFKEQQKYADSYEARLNRLDTAWNKFVLSASNAVVGDGLITGIETLNDLTTVSSIAIDKIGLLSGVFGTLGVVATLLSTRMRVFATALTMGTGSMSAASLASTGLSVGMTRASVATFGLSAAFRTLLASTGIGLLFVGIGFALEKLIARYSEAKQAQEDFELSQEANIKAMSANKTETEGLIASYKTLSEQRENNPLDPEKEKEYLAIQSKLAETYPALISHIDATGQAHLKSSEQIDKEIQLTNKLIEAKKEEQKVNAQDTIKDRLKEQKEIEEEIARKRKEVKGWQETNFVIDPTGGREEGKQQIIKKLETEIAGSEIKISNAVQAINSEVLSIAEAYNKLEIDPSIQNSVSNLLSKLDLSKMDSGELETFSIRLASLTDTMQEAYAAGDERGFSSAQVSLAKLLNTASPTEIKVDDLSFSFDKLTKAQEVSANATYDTEEAIDGAAGAATEAVTAYEEYSNSLRESANIENQKASASEMLTGITSSQIDTIYEQLAVYQLLNEQENLNEQQKLLLADATSFLSGIYPSLVSGSEANVDAILKETQANDILLEAVGRAAKGQLSSQETQTLNSALGAKARIDILKAEILAVDKMVQAHKQAAIETYNAAVEVQNELGTLNAEKSYKRAEVQGESRISGLSEEINKLMPDFQKYTDSLGAQIDYQGRAAEATEKASKANEKNAKSAEKATKEYKNYTYVTDKFAEAIEKVNLALAKQQAIQSKYPKYSKQYRNAIKEEIKQLEKKEKLLTSQAKSLDKQIKSGKIKETGVVEVGGSGTTVGRTTSGTKKYSTKVTGSSSVSAADLNAVLKGELKGMGAVFIREAAKAGLDPAFLASVAMHESGNGSSKAVKNKNNAFGIMGSNGLRSFSSLEQNIAYTADMFKRLYTSKGLDSIVEIQKKYAPDGAKNDPNGLNSHWQKGVLRFWNQFTNTITTTATKTAEKATKSATKNLAGWDGRMSSAYGMRTHPITGKRKKHAGIDIAGNTGDRLDANVGGKVIASGTYGKGSGYSGYGNVVVVKDNDGLEHLYAHLEKTLVKVGDVIDPGQKIGTIGSTGNSTGPHLHYEVRKDGYGTEIDPTGYYKNAKNNKYAATEEQSEASKQAAEQSSNVADAQSEVLSLQEEQLQVEQQIQELRMELVQSNLAAFDHERKLLEDDLAKVDLLMQKAGEGTDEWVKQQLKKEKLLAKEIDFQKDSIDYLKAELKYNKHLTAAQKATLNEELIDRTTELYSLESQLLSEREAMAEQAIDAFKQALEAQKEAAVKAIDKMIDAINKEAEDEDYAKNLADAQKEKQKTQDEIAQWELNDSPEAQKKLQELNESLQEQDESIAEMQTDRERELRVDNLEKEKEKVETDYDNLINDEKKFAQMRSDIINGNAKQIIKDLEGYAKNIRANANILGKAVSSNLIDLINQANKYLNGKDYKPIKVAQAKEGGILPSWSNNNGRMMYVHPEEMISNKSDTKNILEALKMSQNIIKQPYSSMNIQTPTFAGNQASAAPAGNNINMTVHIGNITGDEGGTRTMLSNVLAGVSKFVR
ncbi:phage tail tape measure protein [Peribacillus simplex]|uniref:phage tail tape measure protein n=1 Tax=Peribacillus simplex TaxID=1478 RepID=UPI002E24FCDB|nr:phage tail tape measure protein [Peribacillus simplex]MED3912736.1 phage tail tape measure protein [Peribacillus simplex]